MMSCDPSLFVCGKEEKMKDKRKFTKKQTTVTIKSDGESKIFVAVLPKTRAMGIARLPYSKEFFYFMEFTKTYYYLIDLGAMIVFRFFEVIKMMITRF